MSCESSFTDPTRRRRQRNLQHSIAFVPLPYNETTVALTSGEYAACGFKVHLERKRHQLIFQVYLPCVLFVGVSWASFLIRPEVVPGRMALLVTLFLVLINIFNTARFIVYYVVTILVSTLTKCFFNVKYFFHPRSHAPIPTGTTLNAMDIYLVTSILMVFLALVEYAVILGAMHVRCCLE